MADDDRPFHPDHSANKDAAWLVVDAMNVIGSRPNGWWRDRPGAIRKLVARLRMFAQDHDGPVTVVIDGRPLPDLPEGLHGALDVRYARRAGPNAADDRIIEALGERWERVEVVTADRNLRERVDALGAGTLGPRQFLERLDRLDENERPH